jgi:hypothetical protein
MKIRTFNIIFALIIIYSCSKSSDNEQNYLKVKMKVLIKKEDKFQLFYSDSYSGSYSERQSQTILVAGKNSFQEVNFLIPQALQTIRIRIDLGEDTLQKKIYLKEISFTKNNKVKSYRSEAISKMFKFNENVEFHPKSCAVVFSNTNKVYDPYLISKNIKNIFD